MKKQVIFDTFLGIVWILSATAMLARVYSLQFDPPPNELLIMGPYLIVVLITAYMTLTKKGKLPIIFIIGTALILHSIAVVREPAGINWGKDSNHDFQIAKLGLSTGSFDFGNPNLHSHSYDQSFYPGLEFLTSALNLVGNIPLSALYNYTFVVLNLLTLVFFFFLLRRILKNSMTVNIALFLYALCPLFNSFDSSTLHESLAIILFPLVLSFFLLESNAIRNLKKTFFIAASSACLIAITNEFTTYVLTFSAVVLTGSYLFIGKIKKQKIATSENIYKVLLAGVCVSALFIWLFSVATYYVKLHSGLIDRILLELTGNAVITGNVSPPSSLPIFQTYLTYAGLGTLLLLSLFGVYTIMRRQRTTYIKNSNYFVLAVWWLVSIGLLVVFEVVPWSSFGESPIRFRSVEFSYFGITAIAAIAFERLIQGGSNWVKKVNLKKTVYLPSILLIALIAIPTIYVGFPRIFYDNQPPVDMGNLNPVQAYHASNWLARYSPSTLISGTQDGEVWISGVAGIRFSYDGLIVAITYKTVTTDTYYVNLANILIPDPTGETLGQDNYTWLCSSFSKVYDNGGTTVLVYNNNQTVGQN
jgi:hypothetical protein